MRSRPGSYFARPAQAADVEVMLGLEHNLMAPDATATAARRLQV